MLTRAQVIYIGAFLTPESKAQLLAATPPRHATVFAEHITLSFKPKAEDPFFGLLGTEVEYVVRGFASDARGHAVAVTGPDGMMGSNEVPHITVSCAEGVKPVYSNALLAEPMFREFLRSAPPGIVLHAIVKAVVNRSRGLEHVTSLEEAP